MVKIKETPTTSEKTSRKKLILPVFLGLIMVMSIFGIIIGQSNEEEKKPTDAGKEFGAYQFQKMPAGWITTRDGREIVFTYLPDQLQDIDVSSVPRETLSADKIYLSRDPRKTHGNADRDFYNDVKPFTNLQMACLFDIKDISECENLPLKACSDSDANTAVVIFDLDSSAKEVTFKNNCITLKGDGVFITKAIDKIIYMNIGAL